jgi:hypothetical protein
VVIAVPTVTGDKLPYDTVVAVKFFALEQPRRRCEKPIAHALGERAP